MLFTPPLVNPIYNSLVRECFYLLVYICVHIFIYVCVLCLVCVCVYMRVCVCMFHTSEREPGCRTLLHFSHLRQLGCQSRPREVLRSANAEECVHARVCGMCICVCERVCVCGRERMKVKKRSAELCISS